MKSNTNMEKKQAYQTLNLEAGVSETEIKKVYRKLSLQHHPEKNDNSTESQRKFAELRQAYNLLTADFPVNYQVDFGVSEAEILQFKEEEVKDICPTRREYDIYLHDFVERVQAEDIFSDIEKIRKNISWSELNTGEILSYSSEEKKEIYQNWLNHLYWMHGLGRSREEIEKWIESNFSGFWHSKAIKGIFEEEKNNPQFSFLSDDDWKEFKRELVATKPEFDENGLLAKNSFGQLLSKRNPLHQKRIIKLIQEKIAESFNPTFTNELLNEFIEKEIAEKVEKKGQEFPTKDISWEDWVNEEEELMSRITDKECFLNIFLNKILEVYNDEEEIERRLSSEFSASKKDYEILELPETATEAEVKKQFKKLSLKLHPDKRGGDNTEFIKVKKAYTNILGGKDEKLKYDFCLLEDKCYGFANWKKWKQIKRENRLVDEEFAQQIKFILQNELVNKEMTIEEVVDYGENWKKEEKYSSFWKEGEIEEGLIRIEDFCQKEKSAGGILGIYQYQAIERTRGYLGIIDSAFERMNYTWQLLERKGLDNTLEGIKKLLKERNLITEELIEPGKTDCLVRKLRKLLIEEAWSKVRHKNKREDIGELHSKVLDRIVDVKKAKKELLAELNEKKEQGKVLLDSSEDKEKIIEFVTELNTLINSLKERTSYEIEFETEVVSGTETFTEDEYGYKFKTPRKRKVWTKITKRVFINQVAIQKTIEQSEIELLIKQLENAIKITEEEPIENEETFEAPIPVSDKKIIAEEKEKIVDYLDNLIFLAFTGKKYPGRNKAIPSDKQNLTKARNSIIQNYENSAGTKDYSLGINEISSKEKIESIRAKIVDEIIYYVNDLKGGSGRPEEAKKILTDFADLIKGETEIEAGTVLLDEQKELLKIAGGKNNSAKKLTESKRKILSKMTREENSEESSPPNDNLDQEKEREQLETIEKLNREKEEIGKKEQELQQELFQLREAQQEKTEKEQEIKQKIQQLEQKLVLENDKIKAVQQRISELELNENKFQILQQEKQDLERIKTEREEKLKEVEEQIRLAKEKKTIKDKQIQSWNKAIMEVNEYWKEQVGANDKLLNGKTKNEILTENWENKKIKAKNSQAEINTEVSNLKILIDKGKELVEKEKKLEAEKIQNEREEAERKRQEEEEKVQNVRDEALNFISDYWIKKVGDYRKKVNGKHKKDLFLTADDLKNNFKGLKTSEEIEKEKNRLMDVIEQEIKIEIKAWQEQEINKVENYWNNNKTGDKIDWQDKKEFLAAGWKERIKTKTIETEINAEGERLIKLMKEAKELEKVKQETIEKINNHWEDKQKPGWLKGKSLTGILEADWKEVLQSTKQENEVRVKEKQLIEKIDETAKLEQKEIVREQNRQEAENKENRENAIREVNSYWEKEQINNLINGQTQADILEANWETKIKDEFEKEQINQKKESFINLITEAKKAENGKFALLLENAIKEINDYWDSQQVEEKINDKKIEQILTANWQSEVRKKNTVKKVNLEVERLKGLIDEEIKEQTIGEIKKFWKSKSDNSGLDGKVNGKSLFEVLEGEDWEDDIKNEKKKHEIENLKKYFIKKIAEEEKADGRKKSDEEIELNEKLEKLKGDSGWFSLPTLSNYKSSVEKWFNKSKQFISKNNYQFTKEICGEISVEEKDKIISEIEKDQNIPIKKKEDFEKSVYFKSIEKNEIEEYIKEINKIMQEAITEWNQIKLGISEEKKLINLEEKKDWDNKIKHLKQEKGDKLPANKSPTALQTHRHKRHQEVEIIVNDQETKWDQLNTEIGAEKNLTRLTEGGHWDKQIQNQLDADYLTEGNKTPTALRTIRQNRQREVEKKIAELEKMKKENISSLLEKSKKLALELESSPEEVENLLQSFNEKSAELAVKKGKEQISDKELETEKLIMESSVGLIKKIKEVKEAIKITKSLSENYLKGKDFFEQEEIKVWQEKLEKLNSSEKVAQHMQELIKIVQTTQKVKTQTPESKKIPNWIIAGGFVLGAGVLIALVCWINKKRLNRKHNKRK
ncbi:MAG: DnaJ domain-containing protein [Candidatus Moeniiplasma glomeromycotorum]|nr:DnaJ domain-containing protein [Candidatus Moeniiplasma glomeromycotorum]